MPRSSTVDHISEVPNDLDRQVYILKIVMVKGSIFLEISSDIFLFIFWCSSSQQCFATYQPWCSLVFIFAWRGMWFCVSVHWKSLEFAPGNSCLLGMGSQRPSETVGTSLYLTAVTSHFLSACFTYKTLTRNEMFIRHDSCPWAEGKHLLCL